MMDTIRLESAICAIAFVLHGCAGSAEDNREVIRTDSSGVTIVTSPVPTDATSSWAVGANPRIQIGGPDDDTELLHRVFSTSVLDDGRIVVSNSDTKEIRIYAADGSRDRTFGSPGQGPGEFGDFSTMRVVSIFDDSIAVSDVSNLRVNIFRLDGEFGRTLVPSSMDGYGRPVLEGAFADGWLAYVPVGTGILTGEVGDLIDMDFAFLYYDRAAKTAVEIATADGRQRRVNRIGDSGIHYPYVPLTADPSYAIDDSSVVFSNGGTAELKRVAATGEIKAIYRWSPDPVPVSEIRQRFNREFVADLDGDRLDAYERLLASPGLPIPDMVPSVQGVIVDHLGYLWAEKYRLPWESEPTWYILDESGVWLGEVETPADVSVHEIGADYIVGVHRGEQGVQSVVVYDLERR